MNRLVRTTTALLGLLLAPSVASAELRRVQLNVLGMDWTYCAHAVSVAVKKLDGVESVDVSLEKASADIIFKADNKITLPQLRRVIAANGYPTKDAHVTARGTIIERGGKATLDLLNGSTMELEAVPAGERGGVVEVIGVSRARGKSAERLRIDQIKWEVSRSA